MEQADVTIRTKDGMTYSYRNLKIFQVTPYDYIIIHLDGSQRMINRQGVIDIVISADSASKVEKLETIGTA